MTSILFYAVFLMHILIVIAWNKIDCASVAQSDLFNGKEVTLGKLRLTI